MAMTICPSCKADIETDSIFCDQCGSELMKCPQCGGFCRGKFCPKCGTAAIKASALLDKDGVPPSRPVSSATPATPPSQSAGSAPVSYPPVGSVAMDSRSVPPQSSHVGPRPTTNPDTPGNTGTRIPGANPSPSRMVCLNMGITLPLRNGAIIGRTVGDYVNLLGGCNFISGTHARLDFDGSRWTITDLNSRNGTAVNGVPCRPSAPLTVGSVVRIAQTYDFIVE